MKPRRILLDMDEVLAAFVNGVCHIHGISRTELERRWPVGEYGLLKPMGLTLSEFWEPINRRGSAFWANLDVLPWVIKLVDLIESTVGDEWHAVTCPAIPLPQSEYSYVASYTGKARWLKNLFGSQFDRFAITPHKDIFASDGVLLIDDCEENVESFVKAGGDALLFPCRHNKLHHLAGNPVQHLSSVLSNL